MASAPRCRAARTCSMTSKTHKKLFGPDAPLGEKATQKNTFVKDVAVHEQLFTPKKKTSKEISRALCVALCSGGTEDVAAVVCAFHADRGVSVWRWSGTRWKRAPFSARPHGSGRLHACTGRRRREYGNSIGRSARLLTVGHSDGRVRLHDGRGRIRASIRGPHAGGSAVACCGHGHIAVTGGTDGSWRSGSAMTRRSSMDWYMATVSTMKVSRAILC